MSILKTDNDVNLMLGTIRLCNCHDNSDFMFVCVNRSTFSFNLLNSKHNLN